jgi:hypothetical protein
MIDKKKIRVLAISLTLTVLVAGCHLVGPRAGKIAGLKGYWSFDEGKGDIVKNVVGTNHGRIQGGLKWVDGKYGKAIEFNGQGYVIVKHEDFFNSPNYTVTAWTKLKDVFNYHYIVWKNGPEFPDVGPGRRIDIWVDMGGPVNVMWHDKDGVYEERLYGKKAITDDKWHHVVEVYDGKSIALYIDGSLDGREEPSGQLPINREPLWIGARPGGVAATGIIDEVCFYDRALSADMIKTLSEGGE